VCVCVCECLVGIEVKSIFRLFLHNYNNELPPPMMLLQLAFYCFRFS